MNRRLLLAALALETVWAVSLSVLPWKDHVLPFLVLFGLAFAVYAAAALLPSRPARGPADLLLILAAGLLFRFTVSFAPPSLSDDIYRYRWDGRVQAAGLNPYLYPPEDPALAPLRDEDYAGINHKGIRTIYPPLAQAAFRAAYRLSPRIDAQRWLFLGFDAALMLLLVLYLRRSGRPPERVLLYAWHPLVLAEFSSSGHMDSLGMFFLMAGLFAYEMGSAEFGIRNEKQNSALRAPHSALFWAGFHWGLAFLAKFASVPLLPWMLLKPKARRALVPFLLTAAGGYLAYWIWPLGEVKRSLFSGAVTYARDWTFNAGPFAFFLWTTPLRGGLLKILLMGGAAAVGLLLARRMRDDQALAYAGVMWTVMILASPVVHPWYAAWLVPFLCFYPSPAGIAFTGLVTLSYLVWPRYAATGIWDLPAWIPWVEYGVPLGLLIFQMRNAEWRMRNTIPPVFHSAPRTPHSAFKCRPAVIIPALNEEKALPAVLAEIPRGRGPAVIVVDNGSTDRTAEVARSAGAPVVAEPRRGYGRAVMTGLAHLPADRDVVVVMDGDHSDYPEDLDRLLGPIDRGEADFVIGSRVLGGAPPGSLTPQQRFGNRLACLLLRLFFGRRFTDLGPFRAIRRSTLESLRMEDETFGWNVEMQIKAVRAGVRTLEVPVRYRPRIGVSKVSGTFQGTVRAGTKILWTLFKYGLWAPQGANPGRDIAPVLDQMLK